MKLFTWDLAGFKYAYSKYYYMPHLNDCEDGIDGDGHFHDTLHECGRASCVCAFEDEMITYSRLFFENSLIFENRATKIIQSLNIPIGSTVLVVGCAFGHLMEKLSEKRMNVFGCDDSPYIHFNTDTEALFPIHNIDVLDPNFSSIVNQLTGVDSFDYIISEDMITSYDNIGGSYDIIFSNLQSILKPNKPLSNIIHIVDTNCGSPFVKKTIEEWKDININHSWFDSDGNF